MKAQFVSSLFFGFLIVASFGFAETPEHAGTDSDSKVTTERPKGVWDIDKYVDLLKDVFARPKASLKNQYQKRLPIALENNVKKNDETDISDLLAELFTTIGPNQIADAKKRAQKEITKMGEEDISDPERAALLNRLFWAASGLEGEEIKTPQSDAFNKKFLGEGDKQGPNKGSYLAQHEKNEKEVTANVAKALSKNSTDKDRKDAKKALREKIARGSVMSFVEAQLKAGNEKGALDLVEAIAWVDPSGQRFLELYKNGKAERLYLGPDRESMKSALETYANRASMGTATLAREEHEKEIPHERMARDSQLIDGRPKGVKAPKALRAASVAQAQPQRVATIQSGAAGKTFKTSFRPPSQSNAQRVQTIRRIGQKLNGQKSRSNLAQKDLLEKRCYSCHGPKPIDASIRAISSGSMPPPGSQAPLSDSEKSQLRKLVLES